MVLEEYRGPIFPSNIKALNEAGFTYIKVVGDLVTLAEKIPGAKGQHIIARAPDGSLQQGSISIPDGAGEIMFSFPLKDGFEMNRSIAVYTKGNIDLKKIEDLTEKLSEEIKSTFEKFYF